MDRVIRKFQKAYPLLIHQKTFQEGFGFEFQNGWLPMVYELFGLLDDLQCASGHAITISQIKEKFGSLRIYLNCSDDISEDVRILTALFSSLSARTCDICGASGKIDLHDGYWCPRCENHKKSEDRASHAEECEEMMSRFMEYERQGVKTEGVVFVEASGSSEDEQKGSLSLFHFPDRIDSASHGVISLLDKEKTEERPVDELAGVIDRLRLEGKVLIGFSDASEQANRIMSKDRHESSADAIRALRDNERY